MLNKRIVYTRASDGGVSVVVPAPNFKGTMEDLLERTVPAESKASAEIVDVADIPTDRTFRDAWVQEPSND